MKELDNLKHVHKSTRATSLPSNLLLSISKYARRLEKETGYILSINSEHVFQHIHHYHLNTSDSILDDLYLDITKQVNLFINNNDSQRQISISANANSLAASNAKKGFFSGLFDQWR